VTEHGSEVKVKNALKGYLPSGKMNVYLKWVIYVEEMYVKLFLVTLYFDGAF